MKQAKIWVKPEASKGIVQRGSWEINISTSLTFNIVIDIVYDLDQLRRQKKPLIIPQRAAHYRTEFGMLGIGEQTGKG